MTGSTLTVCIQPHPYESARGEGRGHNPYSIDHRFSQTKGWGPTTKQPYQCCFHVGWIQGQCTGRHASIVTTLVVSLAFPG